LVWFGVWLVFGFLGWIGFLICLALIGVGFDFWVCLDDLICWVGLVCSLVGIGLHAHYHQVNEIRREFN